MLSLHVIERDFETHRHDALLKALAANGLPLSLPLQVRLSQSVAAIVALGLRRLIELSYGPTRISRRMVDDLLHRQAADGSFDHDPLATAVVTSALDRVLREQSGIRVDGPCHAPRIQVDPAVPGNLKEHEVRPILDALLQALQALAQMQAEDGLFDHPDDRSLQDRAHTAAFMLMMLADCPCFAQSVRHDTLMAWFEQQHDRLDPQTEQLWLMGRLCESRTAPTAQSMAAA